MIHLKKIVALADDRRGAVIMIFALAIVPILGLAGLALDYGSARINGTRMQSCLDSAVLASARAAREVLSSATGTKDAALEAAKLAVDKYVNESCASAKVVATKSLEKRYSITYGSLVARVIYKGSSKSFLGQLFGVSSLPVSVESKSESSLPVFLNTYLLIDNSQSMGIASTAAGRKRMKTLTTKYAARRSDMNCTFACHAPEKDGRSFFELAVEKNIDLRIDTLRTSLLDIVEQTRLSQAYPGQFKFDVTIFNRESKNLLQLSDDFAAIKKAISEGVVLSDVYNMATTYPEVALDALAARLPRSGDGITASTPKVLVIFATDGVADETNFNSFSGRNANRPGFSPVLKAGACDGLSRTGARIAVIETTYTPIPDNQAYQNHVGKWYGQISPALEKCASSPSLHFKADVADEIERAFREIFDRDIYPLRLTQ